MPTLINDGYDPHEFINERRTRRRRRKEDREFLVTLTAWALMLVMVGIFWAAWLMEG